MRNGVIIYKYTCMLCYVEFTVHRFMRAYEYPSVFMSYYAGILLANYIWLATFD